MERYGFPIVLNKFYEFKVVVSSIGEGQDAVGFSKGDLFIWTNEERPEFDISVPSPLLVSADQQFKIFPESFRFSDEGYSYDFSLTPEEAIEDPSKV